MSLKDTLKKYKAQIKMSAISVGAALVPVLNVSCASNMPVDTPSYITQSNYVRDSEGRLVSSQRVSYSPQSAYRYNAQLERQRFSYVRTLSNEAESWARTLDRFKTNDIVREGLKISNEGKRINNVTRQIKNASLLKDLLGR